jgi:4-hydroxy-tetrahydrodipicolinate reductase
LSFPRQSLTLWQDKLREAEMADTRIAVLGCAGRMGRMLVADVVATAGCALAGGTTRAGSAAKGGDVGEIAGIGRIGLAASDNAERALAECDVAIDFTTAAATAEHAALAVRLGKPMVIGTTGLHGAEEEAVRKAASRVPIVWAANTSLGINLLLGLVEQVAQRLGTDWDIEIMEMHHRGKIDAPSGTALALGRVAAEARGADFAAVAQRGRDGITGARQAGAIGFAALRGGDNIGEHHVIFAGAGEQLELSHRATNRGIYAKGAVRAAMWLVGKPPGLYGMKEVLGL